MHLSDTVEIKREVVEEEKEAYVPCTASQSIETASRTAPLNNAWG
jgi:hypothetical protein